MRCFDLLVFCDNGAVCPVFLFNFFACVYGFCLRLWLYVLVLLCGGALLLKMRHKGTPGKNLECKRRVFPEIIMSPGAFV